MFSWFSMLAVTVLLYLVASGGTQQGRGQERGGEAVPLLDYILISRALTLLGCYLTVLLGGENLWIQGQHIRGHKITCTVVTS